MQFEFFALLTLAVASVNGAALKRSGTCTCGSSSYSATDTQNAVTQGKNGTYHNGRTKYPHEYKGYDAGVSFPSTCQKSWNEFPILAGGNLYNGGPPGTDRVVYGANGAFCGCITHTGATTRNGFVQCT